MYTSNWCPYCVAAKNFFQEHNIEFKEINIEVENISREEFLKLSVGYTIPQIFINNKCIGGYDELINLYQKNRLKELLNE